MSVWSGIQASPTTERADSAYNKEDYRKAIRLYTSAIENEGVSPELYYDLGNAYYRTGDLGRAVLNYERALKIDPSYENARVNLAFVNTKILDKPEDDTTFLSKVYYKILVQASPDAWAWIAFAMFLLVMCAASLYVFSSDVTVRKAGFFSGIILLVLFIYSLIVAWQCASASHSDERAVVIVPTTHLSSTPRATGKNEKVVPIHEGTRVEIVDSVPTPDDPTTSMWYEVKINNSTRAWLRAADVERI